MKKHDLLILAITQRLNDNNKKLKFRSKKSDIIPYKIKPETDFFIKKCKKDTHFLVKLR